MTAHRHISPISRRAVIRPGIAFHACTPCISRFRRARLMAWCSQAGLEPVTSTVEELRWRIAKDLGIWKLEVVRSSFVMTEL